MINFKIENMCDEFAKQISNWKYDEEYEIYNTDAYESMKIKNSALVNPEKKDNYLCFISDENELFAYINMMKRDNGTIFLGVGLKPSYCGKGLGKTIIEAGLLEIRKRYQDAVIELQVRSWNQRAINCYKSVGFKISKTEITKDHNGEETKFIFMTYQE